MAQFHLSGKESPLVKGVVLLRKKVNTFLRIDRLTNKEIEIFKGSQWASLSSNAVSYLLSQSQAIKRMTKFSLCADEVYKQTWIMNADEPFLIWSGKDIRYIDWEHHEGCSPHTLTCNDYDLLMRSDCLFARKFDFDVDKLICQKICESIKQ